MTAQTYQANGSFGKNQWLILLILLAFSTPCAWCQRPNMEISTQYSYLRANPSGGGGAFNANGGVVTVAWNIKPRLGLVADIGVYQFGGQPAGVSGRLFTSTIGPRFSSRSEHGRWRPFGQALVGGARLSGRVNTLSAGENGFALMIGGGMDARVRSRLAIRCVEVNYLMTRFDRLNDTAGIQNDLRVSTGLVYRFDLKR